MSGILNVLAGMGGQLYNKMVAGLSGSLVGYLTGTMGSITPSTDSAGRSIQALYDTTGPHLYYELSAASNPGQNAFTTLEITGPAGAKSFASASVASYNYTAGVAIWNWATNYGFSNGNTYRAQTF